MSHFSVMVLHKEDQDIDNILYPYWELDLTPEDARKDSRAKFNDETDKVIEEYKTGSDIAKAYNSIEEFAYDWYRYTKINGKYGYYDNPNAKWDWFQIGGRWKGHLILKKDCSAFMDGEASWRNENEISEINQADSAYINDIDFDVMDKNGYGGKATFAVIDIEGKWNECASMGWFCREHNEKESSDVWREKFHDIFLKNLSSDTIVTIIDCHI